MLVRAPSRSRRPAAAGRARGRTARRRRRHPRRRAPPRASPRGRSTRGQPDRRAAARSPAPAGRPPPRRWCAAPRGAATIAASAAASAATSSRPRKPQRRRHVVGSAAPGPAGRGTRAAPGRRRAARRPDRSASADRPPEPARRQRRPAPAPGPRPSAPRTAARSGSSTPEPPRTRDTSRVASSEWPPRSKKSSCDPDPLDAQQLGQDPRQQLLDRRRAAPRTARPPRASPRRPRQRPAVHLAVGVSGSAARTTKATAPCSSGSSRCSRPAAASRSSRPSGAAASGRRVQRRRHHVGHQPAVAGVPSRPATAASRTPGWRASAASISPSSMRKPRILTWWSSRPRNSSVAVGPPARQVAGAVEPRPRRARERIGHEALGGQVRPAEVAARQAAPPM